jgi:hypothetical protein
VLDLAKCEAEPRQHEQRNQHQIHFELVAAFVKSAPHARCDVARTSSRNVSPASSIPKHSTACPYPVRARR